MCHVTVRWHVKAVDELAELWLTGGRDSIEKAANEIDSLLAVEPSQKGRPFALAMLDAPMTELLIERVNALPEDLRWIRLGPVEVLFWPRELDGMAIVLLIQKRTLQM